MRDTIPVHCPNCEKVVQALAYARASLRCSQCNKVFVVNDHRQPPVGISRRVEVACPWCAKPVVVTVEQLHGRERCPHCGARYRPGEPPRQKKAFWERIMAWFKRPT
jgi:hypothetical protein